MRTEWTSDLTGTSFVPPGTAVILDRVTFADVDFTELRLAELLVQGSIFSDCRFTGVSTDGGSLGTHPGIELRDEYRATMYRRCRFDRCDLSAVSPGWARYEGCTFVDCRLVEWKATDASFVECSFRGTSLREATFSGWSVGHAVENELLGNDFSGADLLWTGFVHGVDLRAQTWPDDDDIVILANIAERVRWAAAQTDRSSDPELRRLGRFLLEGTYGHAGARQRDLLVHRATVHHPISHELMPRLLELLEQAPA